MLIQFYRNVGWNFDSKSYAEGIGGLQTQAIELARELVKVGHKVEAYMSSADMKGKDGVEYKNVSGFKGDGDIIIGVNVLPDRSFNKKGKWISWIHTPGFGCYSSDMDYIVCNSKWTLEYLEKNIYLKNKILIPNGFYFDKHVNFQRKEPYSIVLAGSTRKGFKEIPEIFKRVRAKLPLATFDVYGGARLWGEKEDDYKYLLEPMKEAGINYHGLVSKEKLNEVYKRKSVYFQPRCEHTETFGLSVIEAMASGCVPVCSKKGNLTNLITEKSGILLDYNENIDEAEVLVNLLTNNEKLARLRKGAVESVKKYDWTRIIKLWEQIL